jgi:hypothetical protein
MKLKPDKELEREREREREIKEGDRITSYFLPRLIRGGRKQSPA